MGISCFDTLFALYTSISFVPLALYSSPSHFITPAFSFCFSPPPLAHSSHLSLLSVPLALLCLCLPFICSTSITKPTIISTFVRYLSNKRTTIHYTKLNYSAYVFKHHLFAPFHTNSHTLPSIVFNCCRNNKSNYRKLYRVSEKRERDIYIDRVRSKKSEWDREREIERKRKRKR